MSGSNGGNQASSDDWTVLRLLEWTTGFLSKHGSSSPRLDAEVLLGAALDCSRIDLYTRYAEVASESQRECFRSLVKRRSEGAPVAYLVGEREFYSRPFQVNADVLVPRPETEFIILELLDVLEASPRSEPTIVDVGTGSGVLAVTAALEIPTARIVAVDVSPAALDVARANADRHQVAHRIEFVQGDLLADIDANVQPDVILSNPPYVSESEWQALEPTVRDFEPRLALVAGPTGTETIARLIDEAGERLGTGGHLIFELSPMLVDAALELVNASGDFTSPRVRQDLAKHPRVVSAERS